MMYLKVREKSVKLMIEVWHTDILGQNSSVRVEIVSTVPVP
jgi:hypothetical protein